MKPIAKGEEITLSYLDTLIPYSSRREELERKYSFTCHCAACELPTLKALGSDMNRTQIAEMCLRMPDTFRTWLKTKNPPTAMLLAEVYVLLELIEQEHLEEYRGIPVRWLAHVYAAGGQRKQFEKWAQEAAEYVPLLTTGESFCDGDIWRSWLRNPTIHPLWNFNKSTS